MSDERDPATDQALPTVNDRPFVQDLVIADIEERKQHGIRKYGTALQSGNGRNMLLDAYEEALDLAIYLRGMLDERENLNQSAAEISATLEWAADRAQSRLVQFPKRGSQTRAWWVVSYLRDLAEKARQGDRTTVERWSS